MRRSLTITQRPLPRRCTCGSPGLRCCSQPFRDPFLDAALRILDVAALGGPADDALEGGARRYEIDVEAGIQQVAIARVADDQPVLAVVADEAFGDALDRFGEPPLAAQSRLFGAPQRRDVVEPEQPLAARDRNVAPVHRRPERRRSEDGADRRCFVFQMTSSLSS